MLPQTTLPLSETEKSESLLTGERSKLVWVPRLGTGARFGLIEAAEMASDLCRADRI